jgi:hypothetical protein
VYLPLFIATKHIKKDINLGSKILSGENKNTTKEISLVVFFY